MRVIVVLGGGLMQTVYGWRTTNFDERDEFGVLGDSLRVHAGAVLYAEAKYEHQDALVLACGGRGQLKSLPDAPTVSSVIKKELVVLGVYEGDIRTEEQSGNTFEQLTEFQKMARAHQWGEAALVSNDYHLPRIQAFIECAPNLAPLRRRYQDGRLSLVSAERTLVAHDAKTWRRIIASAYASKAMQERRAIEREGVEEIRAGRYQFKP